MWIEGASSFAGVSEAATLVDLNPIYTYVSVNSCDEDYRRATPIRSLSSVPIAGNFGSAKPKSLAIVWAAQNPVTNARAKPPAYPRLLNPPASTPATRRPGIGALSGSSACPFLSIAIPPYENVILQVVSWCLCVSLAWGSPTMAGLPLQRTRLHRPRATLGEFLLFQLERQGESGARPERRLDDIPRWSGVPVHHLHPSP